MPQLSTYNSYSVKPKYQTSVTTTTQSEQLSLVIPDYLDASADLSELHYPNVKKGHWYQRTNHHFMVSLKLTPCAHLLWDWILLQAPGGCSLEVDLRNFQAVTAEHRRGKPYSMRHIRNAVNELEELQLIEIKSERLRLQARHPGPVVNRKQKSQSAFGNTYTRKLTDIEGNQLPSQEINFHTRKLTSTSSAENIAAPSFQQTTDLYRSFKSANYAADEILEKKEDLETEPKEINIESLATPTTKTEATLTEPEASQSDKTNVPAVALVEKVRLVQCAGVKLTPQLEQILSRYTVAVVRCAVDYYRAKQPTGECKNPAGWLVECLKGQWWLDTAPPDATYPYSNVITADSDEARDVVPMPQNIRNTLQLLLKRRKD